MSVIVILHKEGVRVHAVTYNKMYMIREAYMGIEADEHIDEALVRTEKPDEARKTIRQ